MSSDVPLRFGEPDFFRRLRHDLRTPVNGILGYSEMLLEDVADDVGPHGAETADALRRIERAGRSLLRDVDELARVDDAQSVTLDELHDLGRRLRERLGPALDEVLTVGELLLQRARAESAGDRAEDLHRILTSGQRMLGQIEHVMHFPAGTADTAAPSATPEASALPSVGTALQPSEPAHERVPSKPVGRFLVADDNPVNQDVLSKWLQRMGHAVTCVDDGQSALDALARGGFDVVMLDVVMPGKDGVEVLRQVKATPELRHLPIIMISALDQMESVVRCIELGAEDYLHKPFDRVLLKARVEASLEKKLLRDREIHHQHQLEEERRRTEELLRVILPGQVVEELKRTSTVRPRRYDGVAVMFADLVGFTPYCESHQPEQVVTLLQQLVERCEELALAHGIQKIKTIGDAFMAASGLLESVDDPVLRCVRSAARMQDAAQEIDASWQLRVGIHVGPVVAGVIGRRQYLFDLWGDTVNVAARLESQGQPGGIHLSRDAWQTIASCCLGRSLGPVPIKGKGPMEMILFEAFRDGR